MDPNQLHREMLVWDAHRDVTYEAPLQERFLQRWLLGVSLDLDLVRKGGVDVQTYAICTAATLDLPYTAQALKEIELVLETIDANPDKVCLATSTAQVLEAKKQSKLAVLLNFEGAEPILNELGLLRMFYRMGVRAVGLTWNLRNAVADGGYEGEQGGGLTNFGRAVVKEMNRLGMLVDVAHMTPHGIRDVLELSEAPIILSHGATGALRPGHHRAYPDSVLEGIARNGGVFCITTIPEALSTSQEGATLACFVDHIEHAVQVMGAEHVGLGADFDVYLSRLGLPAERWLKGLEEVDKWPNVIAMLLERGHSQAEVSQIMGENLLRVYRQVIG